MFNVRKRCAVCVFVLFVFVLGACQKEGKPAPEISVAPEAALEVAPDVAKPTEVSVELKVTSVVVGRYIENQTFKVGGTGTAFKRDDALFAAVAWQGDASGIAISVRVLDANGNVALEQTITPSQPQQAGANFTLRSPDQPQLAAGTYTLEVLVAAVNQYSATIAVAD
jgi:hypothetical protein